MSIPKHGYRVELVERRRPAPPRVEMDVRPVSTDDAEALAELMMDAYVGTIDYDAQTLDDAHREVAGYFAFAPLLQASFVGLVDGRVVSASLAIETPMIAYVMTAAAFKNKGLAAALVEHSFDALAAEGFSTVDAWITEGNTASETVFGRAGFARLDAG